MAGNDLAATANFLFEMGTLKQQRRSGWWMAGVRDPESVAEHSWRSALIASLLARMEGADPARAALLAAWHDTGETRTGDVNHLGKKYLATPADPRCIAADQATGMPAGLGELLNSVIDEFENQDSAEAHCAKDADHLECLIQGIEYRSRGYTNAQRWIDNSQARLNTPSARTLATALLSQDTLDWLHTALNHKAP